MALILELHQATDLQAAESPSNLLFDVWSRQRKNTTNMCLSVCYSQTLELKICHSSQGKFIPSVPRQRRQSVITKLSHVGLLQWSTWSNYFKPNFD